MIETEEFSREQWESALNSLTREAQDHLMTVRIEAPTLGDQILAQDIPLVGISFERTGSGRGAVEIIAARPDGSHLTHQVPEPQRIYLARLHEQQELCLDIEGANKLKTLVFIKGSSSQRPDSDPRQQDQIDTDPEGQHAMVP